MPSFTSGKSSSTAAASKCAAEWRKTSSACGSCGVRIARRASRSSGRPRSTNSPPEAPSPSADTRATSASVARWGEIFRAISAGVVARGTSRTLPSGSVMWMLLMPACLPQEETLTLADGPKHGQGGLDQLDAGQIFEVKVGCDQLRLEHLRRRVNDRVSHAQAAIQTAAGG